MKILNLQQCEPALPALAEPWDDITRNRPGSVLFNFRVLLSLQVSLLPGLGGPNNLAPSTGVARLRPPAPGSSSDMPAPGVVALRATWSSGRSCRACCLQPFCPNKTFH